MFNDHEVIILFTLAVLNWLVWTEVSAFNRVKRLKK